MEDVELLLVEVTDTVALDITAMMEMILLLIVCIIISTYGT